MNQLKLKRINKELKNLNFSITDYFVEIELNNNIYKFSLQSNFPFEPPNQFFVNNNVISYSPISFSEKELNNYNKFFDKCPCCTTILCKNNWNLNYSLINIIDEYELFKKNLKIIENISILKKNINDDIINYLVKTFIYPYENPYPNRI